MTYSLQNCLHKCSRLFQCCDKKILGLLHLDPGRLAPLWSCSPVCRLGAIQRQSRILHVLPRLHSEPNLRVQGRAKGLHKLGCDLVIHRQSPVTNLLLHCGVLAQRNSERLLEPDRLCALVRSSRQGVGQGLGWRSLLALLQSSGLSGSLLSGGKRDGLDLVRDGAAKLAEGLLQLGRVVVGRGRVGAGDAEEVGVGVAKGVDTLNDEFIFRKEKKMRA